MTKDIANMCFFRLCLILLKCLLLFHIDIKMYTGSVAGERTLYPLQISRQIFKIVFLKNAFLFLGFGSTMIFGLLNEGV